MSRIKSNKRIVLLAGLILALVVGLVSFGMVYALWQHEITHTNNLVADTMNASIKETFTQGTPPTGEVPKAVAFKNDSSCASFLRIAYSETWTSGSGTDAVILSNKVNGTDVATKNFNWTDWQDGGDGWYYYKKVLEPGKSSSQLLDKVTFPEYTGDLADYADADYQLYFRMELLQASDSPRTLNSDEVNAKSTKDVWGKTATVGNNGVVTWQ